MERTDLIRAHCKKHGYSKEYEVYWLRNIHCEILFCYNWSAAPHHILTRGAHGVIDEPENLVALCTTHHLEVDIGWKTFADKYFEIQDKFYEAHKMEVPI